MPSKQQAVFLLGNREVPYTLRKGWRSRSLKISIKQNGDITVSAPSWSSQRSIVQFLESHKDWIQSAFAKLGPIATQPRDLVAERAHYVRHREQARAVITERTQYYAEQYEASYQGIAIRNQSTRWGSCSSKKRLNFNYRIALLSSELLDYVIVHEICHLFEMNHSERFWVMVARMVPDYRERRRTLRQHRVTEVPLA